ncbi:MAG TPA: hypothetical protein PKK48_01470 [Phycisphaerae bacterium]|nr:hypothetical protein [Phycisphaerae bacterium]
MALSILAASLAFVGCNSRPAVPHSKWYSPQPVKSIDVNPSDKTEVQAVTKYANARRLYYRALSALVDYYKSIGDVQKGKWADTEMKNLKKTQEFTWRNLDVPEEKFSPAAAEPNEQLLVENVVDSREKYVQAMDDLAKYYEKSNQTLKAYVVHVTQERFRPEETFYYISKATLPPLDLLPCKVIPEANSLYDEALKLYREGALLPAMADYKKERRAIELFTRLITDYPQSTRIAMSAYYIAEIYKEYFREHYLAVQWYQRAMAWDPHLAAPVRFQCAVQYDFNLGEPGKALTLYKAAMQLEPYYPSHMDFCKDRIKELEKKYAPKSLDDTERPRKRTVAPAVPAAPATAPTAEESAAASPTGGEESQADTATVSPAAADSENSAAATPPAAENNTATTVISDEPKPLVPDSGEGK